MAGGCRGFVQQHMDKSLVVQNCLGPMLGHSAGAQGVGTCGVIRLMQHCRSALESLDRMPSHLGAARALMFSLPQVAIKTLPHLPFPQILVLRVCHVPTSNTNAEISSSTTPVQISVLRVFHKMLSDRTARTRERMPAMQVGALAWRAFMQACLSV